MSLWTTRFLIQPLMSLPSKMSLSLSCLCVMVGTSTTWMQIARPSMKKHQKQVHKSLHHQPTMPNKSNLSARLRDPVAANEMPNSLHFNLIFLQPRDLRLLEAVVVSDLPIASLLEQPRRGYHQPSHLPQRFHYRRDPKA